MTAALREVTPRLMDEPNYELPADLQDKLKAPMPTEAVSPHPTKKYLSSIKPAFVIERMNDVFGIGGYREIYREISITSKETEYKEREDRTARKAIVFSATVHATLTIPKYGIHLENFGGSENEDAGDALKGACTDAFTKMCSHLGVGLEIYKGKAGGENAQSSLPACPSCKKTGAIIKGKAEYGGGFICFTKKDGCGAKFTDAEMEQIKSGKTEPAAAPKPPQGTTKPAGVAQKPAPADVSKITIQGIASDLKQEGDVFWVKVGDRQCATKQPDMIKKFLGSQGKTVELMVSSLQSEKRGTIFQIHKVISVQVRP